MNVAVILARGGSKRVPRKNVRDFCGRPMIAWPIGAAVRSGCFDRIIVSTDDAEIAGVASRNGVEVPFVRPSALADDHTPTVAVMRHAVEFLRSGEGVVRLVCCLYATSPFLRPDDLQAGKDAIEREGAAYVVPVTTYPFPIQRAVRITPGRRLEMFQPEHRRTRSQDLEPAYHDAGQFYWGRAEAWLEEKAIFGAESFPLVLPRFRVQDIDTPEDWQRAELLFRNLSAPS